MRILYTVRRKNHFAGWQGIYGFPKPRALATASEEDLGRTIWVTVPNIFIRPRSGSWQTGRSIYQRFNQCLTKSTGTLMEIYGVGGKVANCICLFALHQLDAFPVDTHIRQVLDQHYKRLPLTAAIKGCVV